MLAILPESLAGFEALCARERCPFAVVGRANAEGRLDVADPHFRNRPVDVPLDVILGKPPMMTRDVRHVEQDLPPLDLAGVTVKDAAYRVLQFPAVADKTFLVTIGDRTVGGLVFARPDGRAMAGACGRRRRHADGFRRLCRRGDGDGRAHAARAHRCAGVRPHGGGRGDHQPCGSRHSRAWRRQAVGQLDGARRTSRARMRRFTTRCEPWPSTRAWRSACRFQWARTRCRCAPRGRTMGSPRP